MITNIMIVQHANLMKVNKSDIHIQKLEFTAGRCNDRVNNQNSTLKVIKVFQEDLSYNFSA